jgi:hypothetical protein
MPSGVNRRGTVTGLLAAALVLVACARTGTPPTIVASPIGSAPSASASASAAGASPSTPVAPTPPPSGTVIQIDLEAIRTALIGPSPVPEGWEEEVDELIATIEAAVDAVRLPDIGGMTADEAACATWVPLLGKLGWATGAVLERQVFIAHLGQLASVAPAAIAGDVEDALEVTSAAAAEQMKPDGDREVVARAPTESLRAIGRWAVASCSLPVAAEPDPNTEDWTDEEIAYSCSLDRDLLLDAQEEFREGPGEGRYATHPHELEVSLDFFVYPAWHQIVDVDNDADPPTFAVVPIDRAFCDR